MPGQSVVVGDECNTHTHAHSDKRVGLQCWTRLLNSSLTLYLAFNIDIFKDPFDSIEPGSQPGSL